MSSAYNPLSKIIPDDYAAGLCPTCNRRLTAGCEHSQTDEAQEWLCAQIVAETLSDDDIRDLIQYIAAEYNVTAEIVTDTYLNTRRVLRQMEPPTAGAQTEASYGTLDLSQVEAEHADWLDQKRTEEDARY